MEKWQQPELQELEIKDTQSDIIYEKTPDDMAMWGKYRYWDGLKYIYVDSIPGDSLS